MALVYKREENIVGGEKMLFIRNCLPFPAMSSKAFFLQCHKFLAI